jgi:hypothetical protein
VRTEVEPTQVRRLERWLKVAVISSAVSLAACAAMLVVTFRVLGREPPPRGVAAVAPPAQLAPRSPMIVQVAGAPPREATGAEPVRVAARTFPPTGKGPPPALSPAAAALAAKLHMRPDALVDLAGPDGDVPKDAAQRLERADDAGRGLGKRLGLDDVKVQTFGNPFRNHVYILLLEERRGVPVDPERVREITDETLAGVRATASPDAGDEAARELSHLE